MKAVETIYGAYELKRRYQTHLALGVALGAILHVGAALSIPYVLGNGQSSSVTIDTPIDGETGWILPPVWDDDIDLPVVPGSAGPLPPEIGIPVPAVDDEVPVDYTPSEFETPVHGDPSGVYDADHVGLGLPVGSNGGGMGGGVADGWPKPDDFIPVESQPVVIRSIVPEFPEMARLTGREGVVTVRALVSTDGSVLKAEIVRSSGSNVGFDEAAIESAYRTMYKPAIQNGRPVAVWVTYKVQFKLR